MCWTPPQRLAVVVPRAASATPAPSPTNKLIPVERWDGRRMVPVAEWASTAVSIAPHMVLTPGDDAMSVKAGKRRAETANKRTSTWFHAVVQAKQATKDASDTMVIAHGGVGAHIETRAAHIRSLLEAGAAGVHFVSAGNSLDELGTAAAVVHSDPAFAHVLRVWGGSADLAAALAAVAAGMDIVHSDWPLQQAAQGNAVTASIWWTERWGPCPTHVAAPAVSRGLPAASAVGVGSSMPAGALWQVEDDSSVATKAASSPSASGQGARLPEQAGAVTSMFDSRLAKLHGPISPGCACPACTQHHAGYVQHLLVAHEILGASLLQAHNLAQYTLLFQAARHAISGNMLQEYIAWFEHTNGARVPVLAQPGE